MNSKALTCPDWQTRASELLNACLRTCLPPLFTVAACYYAFLLCLAASQFIV